MRGWIGKSANQQAASSSFGEACACVMRKQAQLSPASRKTKSSATLYDFVCRLLVARVAVAAICVAICGCGRVRVCGVWLSMWLVGCG
jgi:hypothetical protein